MTLVWTKEPPTEPGWYWRRGYRFAPSGGVDIVRVAGELGELYLDYYIADTVSPLTIGCEWAGPIPAPSKRR